MPIDSVLCRDAFCCDATHRELLNKYIRDVSEAFLKAAKATIPHTSERKSGHIPGWNEFIEPVRRKSLLWHNIWVECGRPKNGLVADIMRKTRASYHYAIRNTMKNEQEIVNSYFADAIVNNRDRDFWSEIKRIKRSTKSTCSSIVDGKSSPEDISDYFASKYQELYTSVSFDEDEINQNRLDVNSNISGIDFNCIIGSTDIKAAIMKLKAGKNDGDLGLSSDYFIHACNELSVHIAFLFSGLIVHGFAPNDMLVSTVIPIPKGRNTNTTDSSNYRGISLSSIFGKLFDLVILARYGDLLCTSDYQFGFRAKRSADMCSMILKECISYYINNGGSVYCTFLDATKAFDRVEYSKLFRQLISRGLPPIIIRLLLNMYVGHVTRVEWNGIRSHSFSVCNGVKQGGIVSPVLFCLYIDGLLQSLADLGVGCTIGEVFVGVLAYADDIVLLAPTPNAMRMMLDTCDSYAKEFNIVLNANKSKCLFSSCKRRSKQDIGPNPLFEINGRTIEYVNEWPHLGHIISSNLNDEADIMQRRNIMAGQIKRVGRIFYREGPKYLIIPTRPTLWDR